MSRYRYEDVTMVERNPEEQCCISCEEDMNSDIGFEADYCCCIHGRILDGQYAEIQNAAHSPKEAGG